MSLMQYPEHLEKIITTFRKLPGVGGRTAERFAFDLLTWEEAQLAAFAKLIDETPQKIESCSNCGALCERQSCNFCQNTKRHQQILCIVSSPKEIFSIEKTGHYRGLYHVIDDLLSPLDNRAPSAVTIQKLKQRIKSLGVKEILIAFNASLEGDATAHFLKEELLDFNLPIYRLAFGLPMGSSIEFADPGTLGRALTHKALF